MAEIGVTGAGRQHQRVEVDERTIVEPDASRVFVDGFDGGEPCRDVTTPAQEVTDRPGDLRGGERGGCDLIEKRLKQVMVATVNERDADRRSGKVTNGFEPAEPGADHDHMMGVALRWPRHGLQSLACNPRPPAGSGPANGGRPRGGLRTMSCRRAVQATSGLAASRRARRRWRALRVARFGSWPNNFEDISSKRCGSGSAHFDVANVATSQGKPLAVRGARRVTPRLAHDVAIQLASLPRLAHCAGLLRQTRFNVRRRMPQRGRSHSAPIEREPHFRRRISGALRSQREAPMRRLPYHRGLRPDARTEREAGEPDRPAFLGRFGGHRQKR
jgi:hypothetical protein